MYKTEDSVTICEVEKYITMENSNTNLSTETQSEVRVESIEEMQKRLAEATRELERARSEISSLKAHNAEQPVKRSIGRPFVRNQYRDEIIDGVNCVIGTLISKGEPVEFIIDKDDEVKAKNYHWCSMSGGNYVATSTILDGKRRCLYLHNLIMNKLTFEGKGQKTTVDHINRNGFDNRKCNLRIVSQTLQNINQRKKPRKVAELPEIGELPRHIWYVKSNGKHGDRFAVEFKSEGIVRRTTSSQSVSLKEKFEQALKIREELYNQFPYLKTS
jgi:hypothetical protein